MLQPMDLRFREESRTGFSRSGMLSLVLLLGLIFVPLENVHSGQNGLGMKLVRLAPVKGGGNGDERQGQIPPQVSKLAEDPGNVVAQRQRELLVLINRLRQSYRLPPFRYVGSLEASARRHSSDMAVRDFVSHTGSDGSSPRKRMLDARYRFRSSAENVAAGFGSARTVLEAWMKSPQHRANLLNGSLRELGIGYTYVAKSSYRHYWTLDLGCR